MRDPITELRDALEDQLNEPGWSLLIAYDPMAPFGPSGAPVPAVYATVIAPGAVLGRMCTHTEVLNPCDPWDDELLDKVVHDMREQIAAMRSRQLAGELS